MLKRMSQKGDTIVEVLVAIAIVGAALSAAYITTSRSLRTSRNNQERAEAIKYSESQLERMKQKIKLDTNAVFSSSATDLPYCLDDTLTVVSITNIADLSTYPAQCKSGFFGFAIRKTVAGGNDFELITRWPQFGGGPEQTVKIFYRIYRNQ